MKYAVIGSGAMGYRYGVELQHYLGQSVDFIDAWQPNIDAVQTQGGVYVSRDHHDRHLVPLTLSTPEDYHGHPDVWVIFMKQMQLADMLVRCHHLFTKDQIVFSAMNGWGHFEKICRYFDKDKIFGGSAMIASVLNGPGDVDFMGASGEGSMTFCALSSNGQARQTTLEQSSSKDSQEDPIFSKCGRMLYEDFKKAHFNPIASTNMLETCMPKIIFNSVINSICTMFQIRMGEFISHPSSLPMARQLIDEAYDVCGRAGIKLAKDRKSEMNDIEVISRDVFPLHYPSMYQDISHGRETEVDYINGFIVELGKKYDYACPTHQFLAHGVHIGEMAYRLHKSE